MYVVYGCLMVYKVLDFGIEHLARGYENEVKFWNIDERPRQAGLHGGGGCQ